MNVYQLSAKNCMSHLLLKDTSLMKNLKKPTPAGIKPETSASRSSAVNALHWDSRLSLRFRKIRSRTF